MEERGNQIQNPLNIGLFCVIYIYIICFLVKYFSMVKDKVVGDVLVVVVMVNEKVIGR